MQEFCVAKIVHEIGLLQQQAFKYFFNLKLILGHVSDQNKKALVLYRVS